MAVNGIELAVGQKWKTRGGEIVEVLSEDNYHNYPWYLSSRDSVNNEGYVWDDCAFDSGDLITLIQDEHGFIPWSGGECPVGDEFASVEYKMRDCRITHIDAARDLYWENTGGYSDIIAYRVVKQEVKPAKVDTDGEQMKEITVEAKEEPKYTIKEVFDAINSETDSIAPFSSIEKVQKHLARINHPDYNLYLQLKARFE